MEFAEIIYQGRLVEKYPGAKMFYIDMAYTPVERKADWTERDRSRLFVLDFVKHVRKQGYALLEFNWRLCPIPLFTDLNCLNTELESICPLVPA